MVYINKRLFSQEEKMLLANIAEADLALNINCTQEAMDRLEMHKSRLEELRQI